MNGVLVSSHLCMTKDVGLNGNLFGGIMLSWLDEAGAVTAMNYTNSPRMVTLKVSEVLFKKAVKAHDVVRIYACINKVGRTSLTIDLEARVIHLDIGLEEIVTTTTMVFVNIGKDGRAAPLFGDDHVRSEAKEDGTQGGSANDRPADASDEIAVVEEEGLEGK